MFRLLVVAIMCAMVGALQLPAAGTSRAALSMKAPTADDVVAMPSVSRTEPPCANAFFGGGEVPEGAKCIFSGKACTRKKCVVNKGPCKNNHK